MCPQNPCSSPNPGVPEPQNVIKFRNEVVAEVMNSDEVMLEQAGPPPRETGGLPKGGFGHRHKLGERHMKKKVDVGVQCPQARNIGRAGGRLSLPAWGRGGGGTRPAADRFFTNLPVCLENEAFLPAWQGTRI